MFQRYDWTEQWKVLRPYLDGGKGVVGVTVESAMSGANSFRKALSQNIDESRPKQLVLVDGKDEYRPTRGSLVQRIAETVAAVLPTAAVPGVIIASNNTVGGDMIVENTSVSLGGDAFRHFAAQQLQLQLDALRKHLASGAAPVALVIDLLIRRDAHEYVKVIRWLWRNLWKPSLSTRSADLAVLILPHRDYPSAKAIHDLVSEFEFDAQIRLPGTYDRDTGKQAIGDLTEHLNRIHGGPDLRARAETVMTTAERRVSEFYDKAALVVAERSLAVKEEEAV